MPTSKTIVSLEIRVKELEKQLNTTNEKLKGVGVQGKRSADQVNKSFDKVKQTVGKFAMYFGAVIGGAAVVGAIKKSIDAMKEFEQSFTNVLTLMSEAERKKFGGFLRQGSIDLMKNYGFAVQDVNKALFDSISAGVKAGDSIKFMNEAAKLAKGGVTSLSIAVDGMTSIMNAYRLEAKDAEKVSAAFFTAQKYGKTTVEELASTIGRVAPIAANAKISYQELLSALALLTSQGISTDEATTALNSTINALTNASPQAAKALEEMGIQSGVTAIRENGLGKTLLQVAKAAETNADKLGEMIPERRALLAVSALGEEALKEYDKVLKEVNEDYGEGSSLAQAYRLQAETLSNSMERIKGKAKAAKIALGEFLAPLVKGLANLIAPLEKTSEALIKERTQLNLLAGAVTNTSNTEESRLRLIEQLNAEYPDFLKGLDTEKVTNEQIETALKNVNIQYEKKIKLAVAQEIYNQQAAELAKLTLRESELLIEQEEILNKNVDSLIGLQSTAKGAVLVKTLFARGLINESKALADNILALDKNREAQKEQNNVTEQALKNLNELINTIGKIDEEEVVVTPVIDPEKTQSALDEILAKWWKHFLQIDTEQDDWAREMIDGDDALKDAIAENQKKYNDAYLDAERQDKERAEQIEEDYTNFVISEEEKRARIRQATWDAAFNIVDAFSSFQQAAMNRELAAAGENEAKKEEIRKKYARKEQNMAIGRTIISGAEAVIKAYADLGPVAGAIFSILIALETAASIALISSQKFAKGGYEVLGGRRHSEGGTMIPIGEAEKGEGHAVFTRSSTSYYGDKLKEWTQMINDKKFPKINMDVQEQLNAGEKLMRFFHTVSLDDSKQLEEIKKILQRDREQVNYITDNKGDKYKIVQKKGYFKKMRIR